MHIRDYQVKPLHVYSQVSTMFNGNYSYVGVYKIADSQPNSIDILQRRHCGATAACTVSHRSILQFESLLASEKAPVVAMGLLRPEPAKSTGTSLSEFVLEDLAQEEE